MTVVSRIEDVYAVKLINKYNSSSSVSQARKKCYLLVPHYLTQVPRVTRHSQLRDEGRELTDSYVLSLHSLF